MEVASLSGPEVSQPPGVTLRCCGSPVTSWSNHEGLWLPCHLPGVSLRDCGSPVTSLGVPEVSQLLAWGHCGAQLGHRLPCPLEHKVGGTQVTQLPGVAMSGCDSLVTSLGWP